MIKIIVGGIIGLVFGFLLFEFGVRKWWKMLILIGLHAAAVLVATSCASVETVPVYSVCPPHVEILDEPEHEVTLRFRFASESAANVVDTVTNGWHVVTGLPELDNYEAVSNYWHGQGMESRYYSNVIYYRPK
jgi:hypothetical protein